MASSGSGARPGSGSGTCNANKTDALEKVKDLDQFRTDPSFRQTELGELCKYFRKAGRWRGVCVFECEVGETYM